MFHCKPDHQHLLLLLLLQLQIAACLPSLPLLMQQRRRWLSLPAVGH
jgi:hypothetical protein